MLRIGTLGEPALLPDALAALRDLAAARTLDAIDPEVLLISTTATLDRPALASLPSLGHVVVCGTSLGRLDLDALAERGISVDNVTHYGDHPAAEVTFMQLTAVARGFGVHQWRPEPRELAGKRCTIVGLGDLGRSMAHLALAYGMDLSYISRQSKPELDAAGAVPGTRAELLPRAEIVILTGPTDTEMLSRADFDVLADGAILVQASGGQAFDDQGFRDWLSRPGNVAIFDLGAGEETYAAYAGLERVIFPRVVAGHSLETKQRLGAAVVSIVRALVPV